MFWAAHLRHLLAALHHAVFKQHQPIIALELTHASLCISTLLLQVAQGLHELATGLNVLDIGIGHSIQHAEVLMGLLVEDTL